MSGTIIYDHRDARLIKSPDGFVVHPGPGVEPGREVEIPFARLCDVNWTADSVRFVGAFYEEGFDNVIAVGPLAEDVAETLAVAARDHWERPWRGSEVDFDDLMGAPESYDGQVVHVSGAWIVGENGSRFGDAEVLCPAEGAAREPGASYRKLSGFWLHDDKESRLLTYRIDPPLSRPHRRCIAGITRVLWHRGDIRRQAVRPNEAFDDPLDIASLFPAVGDGANAGLTFEHPLLQWFEEYRSITVYDWAQRLMSDEEMRELAPRQVAEEADLEAAGDTWSHLEIGTVIVHPGVLRSSANAIAALCDWTPEQVQQVSDCRLGLSMSGELVDGPEAEMCGGTAIRAALSDDSNPPTGTVDPSQTRFVAEAFGDRCDPLHMTIEVFPVLPRILQNEVIREAYANLLKRCVRLRRLQELDAPSIVMLNERREIQLAAEDVYDTAIAHLNRLLT